MTKLIKFYTRTYDAAKGQFITSIIEVTATLKVAVATKADLPILGNTLYDVRVTANDDHLYIYDGTKWVDQGNADVYDYVVEESIPGPNGVTPPPADSLIVINEQFDDYTLVLLDSAKLIDMNKATAVNLVIPRNSDVAFPIGTNIALRQKGAGQVTITPFDGTVTVNNPDGLLTINQYSVAVLIKINTNTWTAYGLLES